MGNFFNTLDIANGLTLLQRSLAVSAILTGTLTETVLATINIPANFLGPNDKLQIQGLFSIGTVLTTTNTVRIRSVNVAGNQLASVTPATNIGDICFLNYFIAQNATNMQTMHPAISIGNSTSSVSTDTLDMTLPQVLVLTAQLSNIANTAQLLNFSAYKM